MNIHEDQAKSLLAKFGVAVPRGAVAYTSEEAESAARELGGPVWVVKSQIHAGGRGAGRFQDDPDGKGGVRVVKSIEERSEEHTSELQSLMRISYAVFCLKKKNKDIIRIHKLSSMKKLD